MSTSSDVVTLLNFLNEVYVSKTSDPRTVSAAIHASSIVGPNKELLASASNALTSLSIPEKQHYHQSLMTPSTAGSINTADFKSWESGTTALPQPNDPDRPKPPPFIPADYVKLRKPWEEEMRKNAQNYAMEIKVRELEDANSFSRNPTPSVKARKFGRSVVNLLRTKSHFAGDQRYEQPTQ